MRLRTATAALLLAGVSITIPTPAQATACQGRTILSQASWGYSIGNRGIFSVTAEKLPDCRARMRLAVTPRAGDSLGCNLSSIRGWKLNPSSVQGYNLGVSYVVCSQNHDGWRSRWYYFTPTGTDHCFDMSVTLDRRWDTDSTIRTPLACGL